VKLDLHTHSTHSDGAFSPADVVDQACRAGLRVLSITDHDSIASWEPARAAAEGRGLHVIPGVEISAAWEDEEIHILGYFRRGVPDSLRAFLVGALRGRETRMRELVDRVRKRGVPVDFEDVRKTASGESLSRAHLARLMVARGHAKSIDDAFESHLGYQHGLVPLAGASAEQAIRVILEADGVAVWAHPPAQDLEARLQAMVKWGLRGVEAFRRRIHGVKTARLVELGDSLKLYTTAGSDWHGHGGEELSDSLSFPPHRLRPFLAEFGLDHLAA
jgi:hypothetical protein